MYGKGLRTILKTLLPEPARRWGRSQQKNGLVLYSRVLRRLRKRSMGFQNREGFSNFNFALFECREKDGVSALLRVKNEQGKIYYCLRSIFELFDEIVVVDNDSGDRTMEIIREFKAHNDKEDKIKIYSYPFAVARCGAEHFYTPEDSVHSLCYYYNWSLSKCSFRYVCKWDADMIIRREVRETLREFLCRIQKDRETFWMISGQTVYRDLAGSFYLARDEINSEIQIFPNGFNPRFYKYRFYEILEAHPPLPVGTFNGVTFYELKFTSEDEFSHWSVGVFPTPRKRREWENFQMVKTGGVLGPDFKRLPPDFLLAEVG